jgi:hypothetical protein
MGRKKREEEWTREDWDEWYHQQIEKLARSLIPKMKTILKKMEWDEDTTSGENRSSCDHLWSLSSIIHYF